MKILGRKSAYNRPGVGAPETGIALALPPRCYCPHVPTPKQLAMLACPRTEAFFGGAAGGGKTDALLMGALQFVEWPNYNALLLRRTFRQLNQPNSIMNRARQWLARSDAIWSEADKRFTFPSGATITFGNLDREADIYQYDSSEFQYIGFDEVTSFSEAQYTYLFSRLRTTKDNPVPLRMRSASNPGNRGHDWVKQRFMIGQPPEMLQKDFPTRFFLPARISDNPHICVATTISRPSPISTRCVGVNSSTVIGRLQGAATCSDANGSRSSKTGRAK